MNLAQQPWPPHDDKGEAKAVASPLPWSEFQRLRASQDARWLVDDLIGLGGFALMYGESGSGKTFLALSLAAVVARGEPWYGRAIEAGSVVYVPIEDRHGLARRLEAFALHHDVDRERAALFISEHSLSLRVESNVSAFVSSLEGLPEPPKLVVIDTLSRALGGGDENASADMGAAVAAVDRIRARTGAAVLLVHHAGKDTTKGARGHSLLRAAVDTEIEVVRNGDARCAILRKQRDGPDGLEIPFRLHVVKIAANARGEPVTSCVAVPAEPSQAASGKAPLRLTKSARIALNALHEALNEQGKPAPPDNHIPTGVLTVTLDQWRERCYERGISSSEEPRARRAAFQRAHETLNAAHRIGTWNKLVWAA